MKKMYTILTIALLVIAFSGIMIGMEKEENITGHATADGFFQRLFGISASSEAANTELADNDAVANNANQDDLPEDNDAGMDNPNNPDLPGSGEGKCKVINTFNYNPVMSLNDICMDNGLECQGVEFLRTTVYFDDNGKTQAEEKNYKWLNQVPNCELTLNPVSQDQTMPEALYAEPYVGPINIETKPTAVLCC